MPAVLICLYAFLGICLSYIHKDIFCLFQEFMGTIRGITPEGLLRMEAEGCERTFGFKEVSYIL